MTSLLVNYDYVIIQTGYTSRISRKFGTKTASVINKIILPFSDEEPHSDKENHLVCIVDKLWGTQTNNEFTLYGKIEDYQFVKSFIDIDGILLFKNINLNHVYKIINKFNTSKYKFCEFCSIENIYKLNVYEKDNKKILHVCVDTESG
jgi:hypothetical protein